MKKQKGELVFAFESEGSSELSVLGLFDQTNLFQTLHQVVV
jgi:hypothetical protein